MKHKIITLAVISALAATPVMADEAARKEARISNLGIVAGGVLGAVLGGPPGAIAGMAVGGITADRELKLKRNDELTQSLAVLSVERDSLRSDHRSQRARLAELTHRLGEMESLAAGRVDAELLAHGLELEVGFRTDSATLPDAAADTLGALAGLLRSVPGMEVHLDGYTDPRGTEQHNLQLSAARAAAVRDRLVAAGVSPERIHLTAHGAPATLGLDAAADPDGWALQRRVSVRLETAEGRLAARSQ